MAKDLHLYLDLISQPSRAIFIFSKITDLEAEIHTIDLRKGENKTAEFRAVNPLCQVPALVDNGFKLWESHAILRYLATTRGVSDNWYPSNPQRRARIDSILDWHHGNLRRGAAWLVFGKVLAPKFGLTMDEKEIAEAEKTLNYALSTMDRIWLEDESSHFLGGASELSIADLSLCCEIKQLEMLGAEKNAALLAPWEKVRKWLAAVEEATSPHFAEAHVVVSKIAAKSS